MYDIMFLFRYTSKFREQVKQEELQNKTSSKTMGPAKVEVPSPDKYLLKHSKGLKLPESKSGLINDGQKYHITIRELCPAFTGKKVFHKMTRN